MFHLYCDRLNSKYTLTSEGETWKKGFDSFEEAYEHAEARATSPVAFVLHNNYGLVLFKTAIYPLEPELLKARAHWRELLALDPFEEMESSRELLAATAV